VNVDITPLMAMAPGSRFAGGDFTFRELILGLVGSEAFVYRREQAQ
jgi:hypothetical protein